MKVKNINIVDLATALAVGQTLTQAGTGGSTDVLAEIQSGDLVGSFRDFALNVNSRAHRNTAIKYALGGLAFKWLAKGLGTRKLAGLGKVNLNI